MSDLREHRVSQPADRAQTAGPVGAVRLPWHLRRGFLLPVLAVLLVGAVCSAVLTAAAAYNYVRLHQAVDQLSGQLSGLGAPGTGAAGPDAGTEDAVGVGGTEAVSDEATGADDTVVTGAMSASEALAAAGAGQGIRVVDGGYEVADLAKGDLVYQGTGPALSTLVTWEDLPHGGEGGGDDLGGSFRAPMVGSAGWRGQHLSVATTEPGTVSCRITTQIGRVLVHHEAHGPDASAECDLP